MKSLLKDLLIWLIGRLFGSSTEPSADAQIQAQKDRADALQAQLDAKNVADAARGRFSDDLRAHPERLREHDAFERRD